VDAASRTEIESHAASGDTRAQLELASLLAKAGDDEGTRTWLERAAKSEIRSAARSWRSSPFARAITMCRAARVSSARRPPPAMDAPRTSQHSWRLPAFANHRAGPRARAPIASGATRLHLAQNTIACTTSKQLLGADAMRTRPSDPSCGNRS